MITLEVAIVTTEGKSIFSDVIKLINLTLGDYPGLSRWVQNSIARDLMERMAEGDYTQKRGEGDVKAEGEVQVMQAHAKEYQQPPEGRSRD